MKKSVLLFLSILIVSELAFSEEMPSLLDNNPWSSQSVCQMSAEDFLSKSRHVGNLSEPINAPGPLNTGLCWWHSKLQRAAIYLAVFDRPQDKPPTKEEARQIFKDLTQLKRVVSIPGFQDWFRFSYAYRDEFYDVLGKWEIAETARLEFLKGIRALQKTDDFQLSRISREVNDYKRLTYLLVKLPTVAAHAWLVNGYQGTAKSFEANFIDSNAPSGNHLFKSIDNTYVLNDGFISHMLSTGPNGELIQTPRAASAVRNYSFPNAKGLAYFIESNLPMSLYLQNDTSDFLKITQAVRKHCGGETAFTTHEKWVVQDKIKRAQDLVNWWRPGVPHN